MKSIDLSHKFFAKDTSSIASYIDDNLLANIIYSLSTYNNRSFFSKVSGPSDLLNRIGKPWEYSFPSDKIPVEAYTYGFIFYFFNNVLENNILSRIYINYSIAYMNILFKTT